MDPNKLFKGVYSCRYTDYKSCGDKCLFFINNEPKKLSYPEAMVIQQRLIKIIYDLGWRLNVKQRKGNTFVKIIQETNKHAHKACVLGPIDESHYINKDHFFSVTNLYIMQ